MRKVRARVFAPKWAVRVRMWAKNGAKDRLGLASSQNSAPTALVFVKAQAMSKDESPIAPRSGLLEVLGRPHCRPPQCAQQS